MSITFDTDKQRLDRDMVYRYLSGESYWARGLPRDIFERSLDGALCIGGYDADGRSRSGQQQQGRDDENPGEALAEAQAGAGMSRFALATDGS